MDNDLARSAITIAVSAGVLAVVFGGIWALSLRGLRISWVDVAWGAGFPLVAVIAFLVSGTGEPDGPTRWLLLAMALVWGLRLAAHNGRRLLRHDSEDPRYDDLLEDSDSSRATTTLAKVAAPQALTMLVVSLPLTVGANNEDHWWPLLVLGVALWAVGVFFETVGDAQLERFKAQKSNGEVDRDAVLDTGLWRYTRHPNYFGDVCNWWGIGLVAAFSWPGLVSLLGPALMTYLIIDKTGSKLSEKKMGDDKPGYADYVDRTSSFIPFIPLPPRKAGAR